MAKHEYRLFLIKSEQDLDFFISRYKHWFHKPETMWQFDKQTFNYPEVLCILDFPHGPDHHRIYRMTQLINQLDAFVTDIEKAISDKQEET
jgi:hypothetical protein